MSCIWQEVTAVIDELEDVAAVVEAAVVAGAVDATVDDA